MRVQDIYCRRAYVTNVVDGDTFDANVDLGFGIFTKQRFRIKGIDAPELKEEFRGARSKEILEGMIADQSVTLMSEKTDSFGRYLAEVFVTEEEKQVNVGEYLVKHGFAQAYKKP